MDKIANHQICFTDSQNMKDEVHLPPPVPQSTPMPLTSGSNSNGISSLSGESPLNHLEDAEKLRRKTDCIDSELSKRLNTNLSITNRKYKLSERGILNPSRVIMKLNGPKATKFFEKNLAQKRILLVQLPNNRPDEEKDPGLAYSRLNIKVRKHFARQSDGTFKDMSEPDAIVKNINKAVTDLLANSKKTPGNLPAPPLKKDREGQNQQDENHDA